MSTLATLLVLLAAFFHALWNALVKSGRDPLISIAGITLGCAFSASLLMPFVGLPELAIWRWTAVSVCIHTAYMVTLSQAYRYGDFSQAYPIARGLAPAMVVVVSLLFLREALLEKQLIAIVGVLLGTFLVASRGWNIAVSERRSFAYALLTAMLIAAYTLVDGFGVRHASNPINYVVWVNFLQAFPIVSMIFARRGTAMIPELKADIWRWMLGGALSFSAYAIVLWAMTEAPIALVAALRETSIVLAALLGTLWLGEPGGWRRSLAALVIFLSVVYLKTA